MTEWLRRVRATSFMAWGAVAAALGTGAVHAQTTAPAPSIPTVSCTTDTSIFNTGIAGDVNNNASYNASSPQLALSGGGKIYYDAHWVKGFIPGAKTSGGLAPVDWPSMDPYLAAGEPLTATPTLYNPYDTVDPSDSSKKIPFSFLNSIVWDSFTVPTYKHAVWYASPFGNAQWIGADNSVGNYNAEYTNNSIFFKYEFNLDSQVIADRFNLVLDFLADDVVRQVYVNGKPSLIQNAHASEYNYASAYEANRRSVALVNNWIPGGRNTIVVHVANLTMPIGMLVQAKGSPACSAKVNVAKALLGPVTASGSNFRIPYRVTVSNSASTNQTLTLSDVLSASGAPLPSGASYSFSCSSNPSPGSSSASGLTSTCPTWTAGSDINSQTLTLIPGTSLEFAVTALVPQASAPPILINTASITPTDSRLCPAGAATPGCSATVSTPLKGAVNIQKTLTTPGKTDYFQGETVSFNVLVKNVAPFALSGVTIKDLVPTVLSSPSWTCAGTGAACPAANGFTAAGLFATTGGAAATFSLPVASSILLTVTGTAPATISLASQQTNTASVETAKYSVSGTPFDAVCWKRNESTGQFESLPLTQSQCNDSANFNLVPPVPVELAKTVSPAAPNLSLGSTVTYTITVKSKGGATSGQLVDAVPTGLTKVSDSCSVADALGNATACSIFTNVAPYTAPATIPIPAGGTLTYTLKATVNNGLSAGTIITNTARWSPTTMAQSTCTVTAGTPSSNATSCAATVTNGISTPIIDIAASVLPTNNVAPGGLVNYTVTASNTGTTDAPNVAVNASTPSASAGNVSIGAWTCTATINGVNAPNLCSSATITSATGPLQVSFPSLPYQAIVVFTAPATAGNVADGTVVPLNATDSSSASGYLCQNTMATGPCQATANFTVNTPVLGITNTVNPSSGVLPGQPVTYTVNVSNDGQLIVNDAQFSLGAVAGIKPLAVTSCTPSTGSVCPTGFALSPSGDAIASATAGQLLIGGTYQFTVTAQVDPTASFATTYPMPARIATAVYGLACTINKGALDNGSCRADASIVTSAAPVLSITNNVDKSTAAPDDSVTFTIVASNHSGAPIADGIIQASAPSNVTLGSWTCVSSGGAICPTNATGAINASGVVMPVGGTLTFTLPGKVLTTAPAGATIDLTAIITSPTPGAMCAGTPLTNVPCSKVATVTVKLNPPVLSITNNVDKATAAPEEAVTFTIVASNVSGSPITDGVIQASAPSNVTLGAWTCAPAGGAVCPANASGAINASGVVMPVGGTLTFTLAGKVNADALADAKIDLTATITSATTGAMCSGTPLTAVPCAKVATVTVKLNPPVLNITNNVDKATAAPDEAVTFTIVATNVSGSPITDGVIQASAPSNVTLGAWTCAPAGGAICPANASGAINTTGVKMPVGGTLTFTLAGKVNADALADAKIDLTATITSATTGVMCSGTPLTAVPCVKVATVTVKLNPPVLSISNVVDKPTAAPADPVTFTIVATNVSGSSIADGVIQASAPSNVTLGAWTCAATGGAVCPANASGAINATGVKMPVGGTLTFTLAGKVNADALADAKIDLTATITSATTGVMCSGTPLTAVPCAKVATVTVKLNPPVLSISNVVDKPTAAPADPVTFTIVATNVSGSSIADGVIQASAPSNVTLGAWTCAATGGAICPANASGAINATGVKMPVGGTLTFTLAGKVNADALADAKIDLTATITSATTGVMCSGTPLTAVPCAKVATVTVKLNPPVLLVSNKAAPTTVAPGGTTTFTVVAKNTTGAPITDGVLTTDLPANLTLGDWACTASTGAVCVKSARITKAAGALNITGINLPVGESLTFTSTGTLGSSLKDGDTVTLKATLNSATTGVTCVAGALPCTEDAVVTIQVAPVTEATPVPTNAEWMLAALAALMLVIAGYAQRQSQKQRQMVRERD